MANNVKLGKVIVVGGSLAGLASAAAVAPYCDQLLVVDKDDLQVDALPRRYAPQGAHIHILLKGGLHILEALLPGFEEDLLAAGAARINAGCGQKMFEYGAWRPTRELDFSYTGQSRPLLESVLHRRVRELDPVMFHKGVVERLQVSVDGSITGVQLGGEPDPRQADLVIDASGAQGRFVPELEAIMGERLAEETSSIGIFYATRFLEKTASYRGKDENVLITPEPGLSDYGGSLVAIEDDHWCLSLHGRGEAAAPRTNQEWIEIAERLADPCIAEMIRGARPTTELSVFKKPTAIWRRFDLCTELPRGYFPVGDVVNSLNPIFGQGMTLALKHVWALGQSLAEHGALALGTQERTECLKTAYHWTEKAWKQSGAYERNFLVEGEAGIKRSQMLRKLTNIQHQRLSRSEEFFFQVLDDSQMVDH